MAKQFRPSEIIELVSTVPDVNDLGNTIETEVKRQIFADKKSIRQSEFYQASATGLKPELMFEVWTDEYQNEEALYYNGKKYKIIRTYDKNVRTMELICTGIVGTEVRE